MCEITESESLERRLESLAAENEVLKAELRSVRSDMEAAAGELLVAIPRPGTDTAKLLHANVMMRKYQIPELREQLETAERERDRLLDSYINLGTREDVRRFFGLDAVPAGEGERS
jgi:predicted RNase H-like nuclease (RuvC/YqgF family)